MTAEEYRALLDTDFSDADICVILGNCLDNSVKYESQVFEILMTFCFFSAPYSVAFTMLSAVNSYDLIALIFV